MIWRSAGEFFAMGGYGLYVWGSFVVCVLALAGETMLVSRRGRAVLRNLRSQANAPDWAEEQP
ncbi:MAG TPA: heme exporter protein CcmD [Ramlibacter sp.]|nr:heme exporter protein CcmD [Ramlibacter sp.]